MHKQALSLILSGTLSIGILTAGCSSNEIKNSDLTSTEITNEVENKKPTNKFNEYNILTFDEIEINNASEYEGDIWADFKCKVTNNSDKMINTISIDFGFYDEEGTLLTTIQPQEGSSIAGGKSFYIGDIYNIEEVKPKEVKIIGYSYYMDDNYYTVDLISKDAEIWH